MWPLPADGRWNPAASHQSVSRVDLWSNGDLVATDVPFIDGSVTEKWVTGIRGTMSLNVPPTPQWRAWLMLDAIELTPYTGIRFGPDTEYLVPLGVFPVLFPGIELPSKAITLQMEDNYQFVVSATFLYAMMSYPGTIRDVAARLITDLGIGGKRVHPITKNSINLPNLLATNVTSTVTSVRWEKSRHDTIAALVQSIGADAYFNRWGQPELRDHKSLPGIDLSDGAAGTLVSVGSSVSWTDVINSIAVTSSKNDVTFDAVIETITDTNHPAHASKIGPRFDAVSSSQVADVAQARAMAKTELAKRSAPARAWTVSCVPDPTRMPGDEMTLTTRDHGPVRVVVQEVTHPLGKGVQQLKLGAATVVTT
jgi:hypothetical protein